MKLPNLNLFAFLFALLACSIQFLEVNASVYRGPAIHRAIQRQSRRQQTLEAYVTLLYGDEFVLGVRVLGKSIRDTGTTRDMVVLVSEGVSKEAMHLLEADGWIIERIELLANPNHKRPKRFWGVYTKLKIFNMTNYKKVVYLDADTIVLKSIEDLFKCHQFCANLKHSERLNSGVMVVEPSQELFDDMMTKVNTLPSYTGGDQGFLNSYYSDFPNAHLFNPDMSEEESKLRSVPSMERLSTLYNADVGLYMLANKWMVDESELRIVHYTLGPLKPWDWWTSWLLKPVDLWQDVRVTLEDSLTGTGGGQDPRTWLFVKVLFFIPLLISLISARQILFQIQKNPCILFWNGSFAQCARNLLYIFRARNNIPIYSSVVGSSPAHGSDHQQYTNVELAPSKNSRLPGYVGILSVGMCFLIAGVSFGIAVILVPRQVMPWTGMLLLYEWTFFLFAVLFKKFLEAIYAWGRASAAAEVAVNISDDSLQSDSAKGNLKRLSTWGTETIAYGIGMASLAILAPCLPFIFGVTALFLRLGMMIGGAMMLVAFMTYASEHLATLCFFRGRDSNNQSRHLSLSYGL